MQTCPNRGLCLRGMGIDAAGAYRCGFEIAGTVGACPRRRRLGAVESKEWTPACAGVTDAAGVGRWRC